MWPALLRDSVRSYGVDAVWRKGLEVLEFPPTWGVNIKELRRIVEQLEIESERKV